MKIVVAATDEQWQELKQSEGKECLLRVTTTGEFQLHADADAFFNLLNNTIDPVIVSSKKPVFINSVIQTLQELKAPENVLRINGWATFVQRPAWEVAGVINENIKKIFDTLGIKLNAVPDEPGLIAARIVAMIINEACFAVDDNVSSKNEIDTAMKLGTNYPYGPFEWLSKIGPQHVLELLQKLYETDKRYKPSPLLITEANQNR